MELDQLPCLAARQRAALSHANELPCSADSEPSSSPAYTDLTMSWQQIYFGQTYALSFNGVNNYATLLNNVLRHTASYHMCDSGYTVDIMFLAHPLHSAAASDTHAAIPGGGMLLGLQDREFGRSRRAARLFSFPMLYIGIDGRLHSAVGVHSPQVVADGQWHRATLTADRNTFFAFLYLDGVAVAFNQHIDAQHACLQDLPRYAILGSGITMGYCSGGSTPVYNCHTLHGLIDEVRLWVRALEAYEVSLLSEPACACKDVCTYTHRCLAVSCPYFRPAGCFCGLWSPFAMQTAQKLVWCNPACCHAGILMLGCNKSHFDHCSGVCKPMLLGS